jgi:DNA-binding MarR family transcriptional regulator
LTGDIFCVRIQKLNAHIMTKIKEQEYALLNEIAHDSMVTQANLSDRLGMAVGSVNWYIKRLVTRGLVKVSHLNRTRLKYDLTPEGMAVFTQRALLYASDSLKVYGNLRQKAKALIQELKQEGVRRVYLDGQDEMSDILRLTCIEAGIHISDSPGGVTLKADSQGYRIVWETTG